MHTEGLIDTVVQDRSGAGAGGGGTGSGAGSGELEDDDAVLDRQYSELDLQAFLAKAGE